MNQNEKMLLSFTKYCTAHPELRFFQALRNWTRDTIDADVNYIFVAPEDFMVVDKESQAVDLLRDTFFWKDDLLG